LLILEAANSSSTSRVTIVAQDTTGRLKCPGSLALKGLELLQKHRKKNPKLLKKILKVEKDGIYG